MANPVAKSKVENLYLSDDVVVNVNLDDYAMLSDIPDMPDTTYFLDKRYDGTISAGERELKWMPSYCLRA